MASRDGSGSVGGVPNPNGSYPGQPHNFTGINSARFVLEESTRCVSCEQVRHRHEGPTAHVRYRYPLGEVAQSLIRVGQGETYTETVRRTQNPYGASRTRMAESGGGRCRPVLPRLQGSGRVQRVGGIRLRREREGTPGGWWCCGPSPEPRPPQPS